MPYIFTATERDLIRSTFMDRNWYHPRSIHDGIAIRRWSGGSRKGQPKIPRTIQRMLDRSLVEIVDPERGFPSARFTAAGMEALQAMALNPQFLPPERYSHLLQELRGHRRVSGAELPWRGQPAIKPA